MTRDVLIRDGRGERLYRHRDFPLVIGRSGDADLEVPGVESAEPLAYLGLSDGALFVQSGPGGEVLLNGAPVRGSHWLRHGDILQLGPVARLVFERLAGHFRLSLLAGDERATLPPGESAPEVASGAVPADSGALDRIEATEYRPPEKTPTVRQRLKLSLRSAAAVAFLILGALVWFMFTARAVQLNISPAPEELVVRGGLLSFELGGRWLLRPGEYRFEAHKEGYETLRGRIEVGEAPRQAFDFSLRKLPGLLTVTSSPVEGAGVFVDGEQRGVTPLVDLEVAPGTHRISVRAERYLEYSAQLDVEGAQVRQRVEVELQPNWAPVTFTSSPPGAEVRVDGEAVGATPLTVDIAGGQHPLEIKLAGHKLWQGGFTVVPGEAQALPEVQLDKADGLLIVRSQPSGASITVDGRFRGQTPLELSLSPGRDYRIALAKPGYKTGSRTVRVVSGQDAAVNLTLEPDVGTVRIVSEPPDAELYVDGELKGPATQSLRLPAIAHRIEIRKAGYATHSTTVTPRPGFEQQVAVVLKTEEEARLASIPKVITTSAGQELRFVAAPGAFTMGASRREQGRRANEVQQEVRISRAFYIGTKEVTNREFRAYLSSHSSGAINQFTLDDDEQPVVAVSWEMAARYCNWLSRRESLPPAYVEESGQLVAVNPVSAGYRLPTEAEWAWVARYAGSAQPFKYPWGDAMPPAVGAGNFADRSARVIIGDRLEGYDDGYVATAPVGSFQPNALGLFDLGGNVAEWVHDFYAINVEAGSVQVDPTGPTEGEFHVIRGSSFLHSRITELRLSYRDYGVKERQDLGFRIARYAE